MKCDDCPYYNWDRDFPEQGYSDGCNWKAICGGDFPPCEYEEYDYDEEEWW